MLHPNTVAFLADLKQHNNKPWFDANRQRYDSAKKDFEGFATAVIKATAAFDDGLAPLTAKQCTFRINRDVRFSAYKSPYKTNMALYMNAGGKSAERAGYYFHAEPGAAFLAAGVWMPPAPLLAKIRQEIDYNFAAWQKVVRQKAFVSNFGALDASEKLSRPPKGYEADNAAIEFLKLKHFVVKAPIADNALTANDLAEVLARQFAVAIPFVQFINTALTAEG
jgi:uncharacterized protein (TIGR02453 family)